jgi:hypothetical protein
MNRTQDYSACWASTIRRCLEVCPRGIIIEVAPVSADELKITAAGLNNETEDIIAIIEKQKQKQRRI